MFYIVNNVIYNCFIKKEKFMKSVQKSENNHFRVIQDCLYNQRLQVLVDGEWKTINFAIDQDDAVDFYPSGALLENRHNNSIHIMFVKNNGEILFEENHVDLDDIGAVINDVNATVYESGVLVDLYYHGDTHHFYYNTYVGSYFHERNYGELVKKVNMYEQAIAPKYMYKNNFQHNKSAQHLFNCLNDDNQNLQI